MKNKVINFISGNHTHKLVFHKSEIELEYLDIGDQLSKEISTIKQTKHFVPKVKSKLEYLLNSFIYHHPDFGNILAIKNLGILFEKDLKLDFKDAITKGISNIYANNKSTANALDSVVPMFLEAGFFHRPKPALYEFKDPKIVTSRIAIDIYKASFEYNQGLEELMDYQIRNPYFYFIDRG